MKFRLKESWNSRELVSLAFGCVASMSLIWASVGLYGSAEVVKSRRATADGEQIGYQAYGERHGAWVLLMLIGLANLAVCAASSIEMENFDVTDEIPEDTDWDGELEDEEPPQRKPRRELTPSARPAIAVERKRKVRPVEDEPEYEVVEARPVRGQVVAAGRETALQVETRLQPRLVVDNTSNSASSGEHEKEPPHPAAPTTPPPIDLPVEYDDEIDIAKLAGGQAQDDPSVFVSTSGIEALARNDRSVGLIGAPKTGKTSAIYAFIDTLFKVEPDAIVRVSSLKKDSFLGLKDVPGALNLIPSQGMDYVWDALHRDLEVTASILKNRSELDEEQREGLPTVLHILDDYFGMVTLMGANKRNPPAIFDRLSGLINYIIVMGREFKVRLCFGTHSMNLSDLGIDGKDIRNGVGFLLNGYETPTGEGDFNIPSRVLIPSFVPNERKLAELKSRYKQVIEASMQARRPMYVSTIGGQIEIHLYPDLSDVKKWQITREQKVRLFQNLKALDDEGFDLFWRCQKRAQEWSKSLERSSEKPASGGKPSVISPETLGASAKAQSNSEAQARREQLLSMVGVRPPAIAKVLLMAPYDGVLSKAAVLENKEWFTKVASVCCEYGLTESQGVAVMFNLSPVDPTFAPALKVYRWAVNVNTKKIA